MILNIKLVSSAKFFCMSQIAENDLPQDFHMQFDPSEKNISIVLMFFVYVFFC